MPNDMSRPHRQLTLPAFTGTVSLAQSIDRLREHPGLSLTRRRDLMSGLRSIARTLNTDPASLPADISILRARLAKSAEPSPGISDKTRQNCLSNATAAFRALGIAGMPSARQVVLSPQWQALRADIPDRGRRTQLSRLARFCSLRQIEPADVDDAIIERFILMLRQDTLLDDRKIRSLHRLNTRLWNSLHDLVPNWNGQIVCVPDFRSKAKSLPPEAFSPGFAADLEHHLHWLSGKDLFAENAPPNPMRPRSIRLRRMQILLAASAWAAEGHDPAELQGLADLVVPDRVKDIFRNYLRRNNDQPTQFMKGLCQTLIQVARHYIQAPASRIEELKDISHRLGKEQTGLTPKNRKLLRELDDDAIRSGLYDLPDKLQQIAARRAPSQCAATSFQLALAIEFLLNIPLRITNLVSLTIGEDLFRPSRPGGAWRLSIGGDNSKNGDPLEYEVPVRLGRMIDRYLRQHHASLGHGDSPCLFPGEGGGPKYATTLAGQITDAIKRHVGIHMTPHQFRHFAAKVMLDENPGNYYLVSMLLGHKNLKTTVNFYAGMRTREAARALNDILQSGRGALPARKTTR